MTYTENDPAARPPLGNGRNDGTESTQDWGKTGRIDTGSYTALCVWFASHGDQVVANLFTPNNPGPKPVIVVLGPVGNVKEQSAMQYATRLARLGFATLIFDPRTMGESAGAPRRNESGAGKVQDLVAALDFLSTRAEVTADQLFILGLCQGVNWAIEAALIAPEARAVALVAGHYLTPEVSAMYLGGADHAEARIAKGRAAARKFHTTGEVDYISVVSDSLAAPEPDALLTFDVAQMYYRPWAFRNQFLNHRGFWENRLTAMSERELWSQRTDLAVTRLHTPTLMIHADFAASGPQVPRTLFDAIPATHKELVWLGNQSQFQFYEDPITIDTAVAQIARFLDSVQP